MLGLENASGIDGAAVVVGAVLTEAIILYTSYGILERIFGPTIVDAVSSK